MGQFLALAREEDISCVMSDHALAPTHRTTSIPERLVETGLMAVGPDGRIDHSRSKEYQISSRAFEVYVNFQDHEPGGIVPPTSTNLSRKRLLTCCLTCAIR